MTGSLTRPLEWTPNKPAISRVPYLPGLDGMRALAVVAVMVYHANTSWLPGGFLGVEVFFVISGYLITLLLIGEHERTGQVSLGAFWLRRAKRLLPALFTLLIGITIYTTLFNRDALGQLRGDVLAGLTYVSNWYQVWVGQGYTAAGDFAPLRHLWSLAVEEQFYLVWPLAMVGLMHLGRRRLPDLSRYLLGAALVTYVLLAVLAPTGPMVDPETTPGAYWNVFGRDLAKIDTLYLGSITRAGGLLLGAAFAMVWRPVALRRGGVRDRGVVFDGLALAGVAALFAMCWFLHLITPEGRADLWLFRGGFLFTGLATLLVIAGVTHPRAMAGAALGNRVFVWIGTRSYGLYLYHWPVYQAIRKVAGNPLSLGQFILAMAITIPITEFSYRFIETPIRTGRIRGWGRRMRAQRDPNPRRILGGIAAAIVGLSVFSAANLATAELKQNEVAQILADTEDQGIDLEDLVAPTSTQQESAVATTEEEADDEPDTATTDPDADRDAERSPITAAAPTTSTSTSTTTTLPPTTTTIVPPGGTLAIGDSVMQGAIPQLNERGILVDAQKNRQMKDMLPVLQQLRDNGTLAGLGALVVHLGTNGPISEETVEQFFTLTDQVPLVVVVTIKANRGWTAGNNAILTTLPERFANVELGYWDGVAGQCTANCLANDGIHLRPTGAEYYANYVRDWVLLYKTERGLPTD